MAQLITVDDVQAVFPDAFSEVERAAVEKFIVEASDLILITFRNNNKELDEEDELLYDCACHVCLSMVRRAVTRTVVTDSYQYGTNMDSPFMQQSNYDFAGRIYWEGKELNMLGLSKRGTRVGFVSA